MKKVVVCGFVSVPVCAIVATMIFCILREEMVPQKNIVSGKLPRKSIASTGYGTRAPSLNPCVMIMKKESNSKLESISEECLSMLWRQSSNVSDGKRVMQISSDKNQVMDELLNMPQIPSDYSETMIALFRDSTQDVVTRDFAVQHIGLYAQALNRRGQYDPKSAEAERCRSALFDAADETGTIVAAAAFRALSDVSEFDSSISARRLNNALVRCASDESASLAARIMAVQLCGERQVKESKESLRSIVSSSSAPKSLRLAARHSIGRRVQK